MEMGITDDYYIDGRVPSVRPSGIISLTEFMPGTDGINLLVKLFNGVVCYWWRGWCFLVTF